MLKKIPKSDIQIRPFKAYKQWNFNQSSAEISVFDATGATFYDNSPTLTGNTDSNGNILSFNSYAIYKQLIHQFYDPISTNNPFLRFGTKSSEYIQEVDDYSQERYIAPVISGSKAIKVVSIPQKYVGEGIKKKSVSIYCTGIGPSNISKTLIDDGYGNLIFDDTVSVTNFSLDLTLGVFSFDFTDISTVATRYTTSVDNNYWNLQTGVVKITYNNITYTCNIISYNAVAKTATFDKLPFVRGISAEQYVGNVFYSQGLIVFNKYISTFTNWTLQYNSTMTIYEHEYLIVVKEDEFNVSTNPSATITFNDETGSFTDSFGLVRYVVYNPGQKYIRKSQMMENGNILDLRYKGSVSSSVTNDWIYAGFEHWEVSGSTDRTGSFLAPMITTIGLYDEHCNLVAVAKLPTPIKSLPDHPINFIIRFDI